MTYLLDTDHVSIMDQDTMAAFNLGRRLSQVPPEEVGVTIITYEEQMRGWLTYISRARSTEQQIEANRRLRAHVERYRTIPLADFDEPAARQMERLKAARVRIGTMDLKIAAIALALGATVLTRNLADFRRVPGLSVEDWSV